ncbi:hypothetical protein GCM10023153_26600 [Ornithinibacter aureus]|uniref:Uncharacterized protein n=1 Tax=Ornithinibacter aureus TaxID=622664 RepID=A0ABP8K3Y5_9MICO
MVVVQVAEQHGVDGVDVAVHGQVVSAPQRSEPRPQERIGEQADPADVEQNARVPEPGGAYSVGWAHRSHSRGRWVTPQREPRR